VSDITVEKLEELGFVKKFKFVFCNKQYNNNIYEYIYDDYMIICDLDVLSIRFLSYDYDYTNLPYTMQSIHKMIEIIHNAEMCITKKNRADCIIAAIEHYKNIICHKIITDDKNIGDNKINPDYYKICGMELNDFITAIIENQDKGKGFMMGNILKYVIRHKEKGGVEDLKKEIWYLDKLIDGYDVA
jgi:hypothetical protein